MTEKYVQPWQKSYTEQMNVRLAKKGKMQENGILPYKNGFKPSTQSKKLINKFSHLSKEEIEENSEKGPYTLAGRIMLVRNFGKASFLQLDDGHGRMQIYIKKGVLEEKGWEEFQYLDYGDIVYVEGSIFKTNKGELSLRVTHFSLLTKSLRPLPEKFHGLTDHELRYRMRYVDMIMNQSTRDTFRKRSEIIRYIREYFYNRDYLEVETPMLHSTAGGATARPFNTHHNSLDMELFLRIAPELHLKRLTTGGLNRVFEINRCFRNEGLSIKHNPEFTSIEFYEAYATYEDFIELTEELLSGLAKHLHGSEVITYNDRKINFSRPFKRMSMREAVVQYTNLSMEDTFAKDKMIPLLVNKGMNPIEIQDQSADHLMVLCFEEFAESKLIDPTFICEFPTEISPLSRQNDQDPKKVDRFELFINGWEMANAFSELNDPQEQLHRFALQAQKKEEGDVEACDVDYDYIRALEYGMPPAAGEGIGIDRLCMILTNGPSIRDVILFPQLKKESFFEDERPQENKE